ncbi:GNAT family N-acetyltransferase [Caballeronia novacaledonica]|uniref:GNAT family N-acetyltransferase n=1 Tax=Caballeronia novacaledonica TaxID=1544861 RepID=UPI001EE26750|nr:GNAT family N-acetyltransferase [Caballeronia novacaledonica]GJH09280.1 GNAT family N-acetyltransferase [Caballeronia novacaledonica]
MRHDVSVEGHVFRLRPIADADAQFVVELRTNPALNAYLHAGAQTREQQLSWLSSYYERAGDYYFVIERKDTNLQEGLVALYDMDERADAAEWGRWIIRPGSVSAIESAWLIYRAGFESLGLSAVYCRTVAENAKVVSFHDSCEIAERRVLPGHFEIGGRRLDAVEHRVTSETWPKVGARLNMLARMVGRRMSHG